MQTLDVDQSLGESPVASALQPTCELTSQAQRCPARPATALTTNDLLKYARGVASWLPAVEAAQLQPQAALPSCISPSVEPAPPQPQAEVAAPNEPLDSSSSTPPFNLEPNTPNKHAATCYQQAVQECGPGSWHKRNKYVDEHCAKRHRYDEPYDICPPDFAPSASYGATTSAPVRPPSSAATGKSASTALGSVPGLPPGLVLIKGFLSLDEQIQIVREIRDLGIGPGGFYTPSYGTGARLSLRMMCLGLHWEPRTSAYEATRSSYDGATPPSIPSFLTELCGRGLAAASSAAVATGGSRFSPLQPDICLANFYERSGRLGMHQDKDEMPDSLRAGLPVVSFSLGDAADFQYGKTRDVEQAKSMRLESGDLLVFGGPSRMIFHSVAKVHAHTAPPELLRATGLRPGRLNLTFRQYRTASSGSGR